LTVEHACAGAGAGVDSAQKETLDSGHLLASPKLQSCNDGVPEAKHMKNFDVTSDVFRK